MASTMWDSIRASTQRAMTQAGEATQVAATKAKLHADILLLDRDINSRKEKFGVEIYNHLQSITSTQEFYVADDRLINVIRPTLIKAQKEVAAYERKRDQMKGNVNRAEASRVGTASIFSAETIGEKFMNAARFASAGAAEARLKTELAMVDRQILGFKEEFGKELYPVFHSMEDNEGWLPTDRKVRSLYDSAREDIGNLEKVKEEKKQQIQSLEIGGINGIAPPAPAPSTPAPYTPTVVTVPPVPVTSQTNNSHASWSNPAVGSAPSTASSYGPPPGTPQSSNVSYGGIHTHQQQQQPAPTSYGAPPGTPQPSNDSYGATQPTSSNSFGGIDLNQKPNLPSNNQSSGFGFIQPQSNSTQPTTTNSAPNDYNASLSANPTMNNPLAGSPAPFYQQSQQQSSLANSGSSISSSVFDPFDAIMSPNRSSTTATPSESSYKSSNATPAQANMFDPFSGNNNNSQQSKALSEADMSLFKY